MSATSILKTVTPTRHDSFSILKSNDLVIGGYASIEMVDKQNDLITLGALREAVDKYMKITKFRNVMTNHSNVQVGEVISKYRDKNGKLWKTDVDDVGFFVVIKMREDIEKAKEVGREIRNGSLRSFSIGGQALEKRKKNHKEYGEYNEISKLELHEVTICEKGINPEAKFDILKMERGEAKVNEIEKALNELNNTLDRINNISKMEFLETLTNYKKGKATLQDVQDTAKKDIFTTRGKIDPNNRTLRRLVEEQIFTRRELNEMVEEHNSEARDKMSGMDMPMGMDDDDVEMANLNKSTEKHIKNIVKNADSTKEATDMSNLNKEDYMDKEDEEKAMYGKEDMEDKAHGMMHDKEDMDKEMAKEMDKEMDKEDMENAQYMDTEKKSRPDLATGQIEAGNAGEYVDDPHPQLDGNYMAKFEDQSTLDLSPENLEKAYAEFKAEQLEKAAYEAVKNQFQTRFDAEMVAKTEEIEKANYDAKAEVAELKEQFSSLLKSLKEEKETVIRKQEEVVAELNIPSGDEIAKMDWSDINALVERLEGQI
tara:strand:+ start:2922 stop:4544 length:1623 start_codon:yes stop_codon:yes gene_type:complete